MKNTCFANYFYNYTSLPSRGILYFRLQVYKSPGQSWDFEVQSFTFLKPSAQKADLMLRSVFIGGKCFRPRECWMIYRGPGFLRLFDHPLSPLSRVSFSVFLCSWSILLTRKGGGGGGKREAKSSDREKAWPSKTLCSDHKKGFCHTCQIWFSYLSICWMSDDISEVWLIVCLEDGRDWLEDGRDGVEDGCDWVEDGRDWVEDGRDGIE